MKKKGLSPKDKTEFQFRVSLFILKLPPRHSRIPNLVPTISPLSVRWPATPFPTPSQSSMGLILPLHRALLREIGGDKGNASRLLGGIPARDFSGESAQNGRSSCAAAQPGGGYRINKYSS